MRRHPTSQIATITSPGGRFSITGSVVAVGVSVGVFVSVGVGVSTGVFVGVVVGVSAGVFVGVVVGVSAGVFVDVSVGVLVAVAVAVSVAFAVAEDVAVAFGVDGTGVVATALACCRLFPVPVSEPPGPEEEVFAPDAVVGKSAMIQRSYCTSGSRFSGTPFSSWMIDTPGRMESEETCCIVASSVRSASRCSSANV